MSDYYHTFLSSVSGFGDTPLAHPPPTSAPRATSAATFNIDENAASTSPQNGAYYPGVSESSIHHQPPKAQRTRRKPVSGPDHVKHRRTRSGCFTCRSRRVKCDETRPTWCRKGKRDCVYPEPSPNKKSPTSQDSRDVGPNQRTSPSSSLDANDDSDWETGLTPIPDADEDEGESLYASQLPASRSNKSLRRINTTSSLSLNRHATQNRQSSETPSQDDIRGLSPTISSATATSFSNTPTTTSLPDLYSATPSWTHLPTELRLGLDYFHEHITHWNYGVHKDFQDFFHTTFLNLALRNEPLLHAIVGFAAYHRTLKDPNGRIQDFLKYYTHAVTLLLGFLKQRDGRHDLETLLTILQLATIEEYFGDWINLMGHQKAALEILTQLFTPQSIVQTPIGRMVLVWYLRFDLYVASMGTFEPGLPRHWMETLGEQCQAQMYADPNNLDWMYGKAEIQLQLVFRDMCSLAARRKTGEFTEEAFQAEHRKMTTRLREWRITLHPALIDPTGLVTTPSSQPGTPVGQQEPFSYFSDAIPARHEPPFTTALICGWHSMNLVHLCQVTGHSLAEASAVLDDTAQNAEAICQSIESVKHWTAKPKGLLIVLHPPLSLAALFLPKTVRYHTWLRQQFAWVESSGYILAVPMRARMANLFEDETAVRWWLPNDQGLTPILRCVRAFADERNRSTVMTYSEHQPRDMTDLLDAVVDLRLHEHISKHGSPVRCGNSG